MTTRAAGPTVYTIPATEPFADSLAAGLLARADGDPMALSRMLVLLPTRRAGRAVRDAFLRRSGGRALLLPRLQPLGDVDEDEMLLTGRGEEPLLPAAFAATPAISEVRRRLMLAEMILRKERAAGAEMRADQAAWLAAELARLLDQVQTEGLSFDALKDLVDENLAVHWQQTLRFLEIVTAAWPQILDEKGLADPALRRSQLLEAQAAQWRAAPPDFPVIAAGSTGSIPATADLLAVVAGLPQGAVVLPGLDTDWLDEEAWAELPPSHPQYGMARLLRHLGIGRKAVAPWDGDAQLPRDAQVPTARARLIAEAMRPADGLGDGHLLSENDAVNAMRGVSYIEAPGPREEAGIIALILREALEDGRQGKAPPRTAALVTPDRELARRVAAALRRWHVTIDDSAGTPLDATAPGGFLRLIAAAVHQQLAPVPLMALLKHPLAAAGLAPEEMRRQARLMERHLLRGPRPGPGIEGLRARLAEKSREGPHREPVPEGEQVKIAGLIDRLEAALAPLITALDASEGAVPEFLNAHVAAAEALATSHEEDGGARLWAGDAGEAAAGFVEGLLDAARDFANIRTSDYPGFVEAMMTGQVVRPRYGAHPRLAILGPLEARLQRPDILVIGGLNEGNWPRDVQPDPWMSRPMRERFGLPALERRVGLAAHDFQQAFCAPRVILTRSAKVEGTPSVPSRWLLRLETVLRGAGLLDERKQGQDGPLRWPDPHYPKLLERLTQPEGPVTPVERPAPTPPVESVRPRTLSITEIGTWMRDPYAIYARHILKLEALDAIDADPGAADRGSFIHDALEMFLRENPAMAGPDALERLLACGREAFGDALDRPSVWAFWWPRFEAIARWVLEHEAARPGIAERLPEQKGRIVLPAPGGDFTLRGRADRLDRRADGTLEIIDYKTGAVPAPKEIAAGISPQLALEALIAAEGGFETLGEAGTGAMEYWKLIGTRTVAEVKAVDEPDARLAEAREGLTRLIAEFDKPGTPYAAVPREAAAPGYSDYALLERVGEWRAERRRR